MTGTGGLFRAAALVPPDIVGWFAATVPAGALLNGLGLGALAVLFATDRIKTKGQAERELARQQAANDLLVASLQAAHTAAIAELVAHHAALDAVKDAAYAELRTSRDYYRAGRLEEQGRANKLTDQLLEYSELARTVTHVLQSLDEAAKDAVDVPR